MSLVYSESEAHGDFSSHFTNCPPNPPLASDLEYLKLMTNQTA